MSRLTFDDVFAVMAAASVGDSTARVAVSEPEREDEPTRLAIALNLLLEDLAVRTSGLRESEESLSITLNSIGDAVIATDIDGRVVRMNPVAEVLTGWPVDDAQQQPLSVVFNIVCAHTRAVVESPVVRVLREGIVVGLANHTLLVARDGTERPIADSGAPIRGADGVIRGVVLVFRDMTTEYAAEMARERARVAEEEGRRIVEADRVKSEFLASMSHELRTPLNAIIGFTEILHDGGVGPVVPQQQEFLTHVLEASRHLLGLINDILDLSKVESGRFELRPVPVAVEATVMAALELLRPLANARNIRLEASIAVDIHEVVVDPDRLRQILNNYVSNAIKFTPIGGRVWVTVAPDGDDRFRIEVRDTGRGIAASDFSRLFQEFQQLDGPGPQGTGLGLAITRRLVEAHGGSVAVTSIVGEGSCFSAVLPRDAIRWAPELKPPG
jgi:PAS domain S-box-containing protein